MDKVDAIPFYYHIETILKSKILRREYETGTRLPPEMALAKEFKVSRVTVRQALASLEKAGLIVRKRGKGTYVSIDRNGIEPVLLTGSMEDLLALGSKVTTKILSYSVVRVFKNVTTCLSLPEDAQVVRIESLSFLNSIPFSHVIHYLPVDIGESIRREDLGKKCVYKILEEDLHMDMPDAYQRLGANVADSYVAPLLNVRIGDPLLKIERVVFDSTHRPVEYVSVSYRADRYAYIVRFKRGRTEDNVLWMF